MHSSGVSGTRPAAPPPPPRVSFASRPQHRTNKGRAGVTFGAPLKARNELDSVALGTTTTLRAGTGVEIRSAELNAAHSPERRIAMRFCFARLLTPALETGSKVPWKNHGKNRRTLLISFGASNNGGARRVQRQTQARAPSGGRDG